MKHHLLQIEMVIAYRTNAVLCAPKICVVQWKKFTPHVFSPKFSDSATADDGESVSFQRAETKATENA